MSTRTTAFPASPAGFLPEARGLLRLPPRGPGSAPVRERALPTGPPRTLPVRPAPARAEHGPAADSRAAWSGGTPRLEWRLRRGAFLPQRPRRGALPPGDLPPDPREAPRHGSGAAVPPGVLLCAPAVPAFPGGALPPEHPLAERYRDVCAQLHAAPAEPAGAEERRLRGLRREAERLGRLVESAGAPPQEEPAEPVRFPDLLAALAERTLLAYTGRGEELLAVTVSGGRARIHRLGPLSRVREAGAALLFAARSRAAGRGDPRSVPVRARHLERLLLSPLAEEPGDSSPLVVVYGPLAGLPWGLLPLLRERPVSAAPSLRTWLRCLNRAPAPPHPVDLVVVGPRLVHGEAEAAALARLHPGAAVLTGDRAHCAAVRSRMARCEVAHIAAHGVALRPGAGLLLEDGPFTAEDVRRTPRLPRLAVLASCVPAGGDRLSLLGPAEALAAGGATVLTGTLPARDAELAPAMVRAHEALAAGRGAAEVVALHLAEAGFVCLGAG